MKFFKKVDLCPRLLLSLPKELNVRKRLLLIGINTIIIIKCIIVCPTIITSLVTRWRHLVFFSQPPSWFSPKPQRIVFCFLLITQISARMDYVENLIRHRHDRDQTANQQNAATVDSCFELVGSRQHGVAQQKVEQQRESSGLPNARGSRF